MKFENTKVYNLTRAIYSARNPMNSWDKSDSDLEKDILGKNDLRLAQNLIRAGSSDRKFMRQIFVTVDITAPSYWCAELDTYKVATTRNSCSMQHKGVSRDYNINDFTFDDIPNISPDDKSEFLNMVQSWIGYINEFRRKYKNTNDYTFFRILRQLMPMGYNYKFTWTANYETIYNIIRQRLHHRLKEWSGDTDSFISWARTLPYAKELLFYEIEGSNK